MTQRIMYLTYPRYRDVVRLGACSIFGAINLGVSTFLMFDGSIFFGLLLLADAAFALALALFFWQCLSSPSFTISELDGTNGLEDTPIDE